MYKVLVLGLISEGYDFCLAQNGVLIGPGKLQMAGGCYIIELFLLETLKSQNL